jgi:PAS domain-containing protein
MRTREAAALGNESLESFVETALANELEARRLGNLEIPQDWGAQLAQRLLECMPTPAVIKDAEAKILWCNFAYEELFQRPRGHLLDRKVTDLGLFEQESAMRLEHDIRVIQRSKANEARDFWEPLTLLARGVTLLFRAHRFLFRNLPLRTVYLGDISFDWGQILPGYSRQPLPDMSKRLRSSAVVPEICQLFEPFLAACPAAIAIKDMGGRLIWCNPEYESLAQLALATMVGMSTKQIFKIKDTHPIIQNEYTVGRTNVWMYAVETLPRLKPRTSLRFPILGGSGRPAYIGVISAEFRQADVRSHGLRQSRKAVQKLPKAEKP